MVCLFNSGADWDIEHNRNKYKCDDLNAKDAYGQTPIFIAARNGRKIKQFFTKLIANEQFTDYSLVFSGHSDTVALLAGMGADVNVQDDSGFSPLYIASMQGISNHFRYDSFEF